MSATSLARCAIAALPFLACAMAAHADYQRARKLSWNVAAMEERLASYAEGRAWRGNPYLLPPQPHVGPSPTRRTGTLRTALDPLECPSSRTRPDEPVR